MHDHPNEEQNKERNEEQREDAQVPREVVAGQVHAACACCEQPRWLVGHEALDVPRRVCPGSGRTYLDRGDGLFAPDGQRLAPAQLRRADPEQVPGAGADDPRAAEPDVLSDRPSRSGPQGAAKSRIMLERATFAAASAPSDRGVRDVAR